MDNSCYFSQLDILYINILNMIKLIYFNYNDKIINLKNKIL